MLGRIIDIHLDHRYLCVERGFMQVYSGKVSVGQVALDDIAVLLVHGHGITYSNNLLIALAARNAVMVVCDQHHSPAALLIPTEGHHQQSGRIDLQIAASKPLKKRLWQDLVRAKIAQQAEVLAAIQTDEANTKANAVPLWLLHKKVQSGDPDNIEAQAARYYWPKLMGNDFRRDRHQEGINALLNYGYAVLRAAVARAIFSAGLHPALSLQHRQTGNSMRLVDDVIEPFRPLVDMIVWALAQRNHLEVTPTTKACLAKIMYIDYQTQHGNTPLFNVLSQTTSGLVKSYEAKKVCWQLPDALSPERLQQIKKQCTETLQQPAMEAQSCYQDTE